MRLAEWLKTTGRTQGWLANEVGVTQGRISQLAVKDEETPSLELAKKIERATGGAVTMHDWPATEGAQ